MILNQQEKYLKEAFISLNTSCLENLEEEADYSHDYKYELIEKLEKLFSEIKSKGTKSLIAKPSECKYCYPSAKAYEFHDAKTDEFVIRYIIQKESDTFYRIQECGNKKYPFSEDGMPF